MSMRKVGWTGLGTLAAVLVVALPAGASLAGEPPMVAGLPGQPLPVFGARGGGPLAHGGNAAWLAYEGARLRYEQPRFGGEATLFVREEAPGERDLSAEAPSAAPWRVYRGRDLEGIARANADLTSVPGMDALRAFVTTDARANAGPAPLTSTVRTSVTASGLTYEPATAAAARILVLDAQGRETLYTGRDFASILLAHPVIGHADGFQDFRTNSEQLDGVAPLLVRNGLAAVLIVRYTPSGVTVASHQWLEGAWVSSTYAGRTLAEIKAGQPGLRALLVAPGGDPFEVQSHREWNIQGFGVMLKTPAADEEARRKPEGRPLVVTGVRDGSPAAHLGLQVDDAIVEIDGRSAQDVESVRRQLAAWREPAIMKMLVVRRGVRMTLLR